MEKKYDVAVYGLWYGNNYGSIITYYALSKILDSMGLTYAMIKNPLGREVDVQKLRRSHPLRFAQEQYQITPLLSLNDLHKLNPMFDTFLMGSDQMWNYFLSKNYQQSYYFDFVDLAKNKISYGTSFGHEGYDGPVEEKKKVEHNLSRFNAISVRDDFSQRMCKNLFHADAEIVCDPVFLCPVEQYDALISQAELHEEEQPFFFAYVLNPTPEFGQQLRTIVQTTGKRILVCYDENDYAEAPSMQQMRERLDLRPTDTQITILEDPTVKEWLYYIRKADFVLTDSFHGCCFSVIFRKNFIALKNQIRGGSRFHFLLDAIGLKERVVDVMPEFAQRFQQLQKRNALSIDYTPVYQILDEKKAASLQWMETAIRNPKPSKAELAPATPQPAPAKKPAAPAKPRPADFQHCQMLAALLRDYGIRHVVLSSGTRHMHMVKFFEANACFTTHDVLDERSAGFYALGLAAKLRKPVAVCCTSGTAASNYLTALSEAYYQKIPLIFITADRHPLLLNQREEQMVPQENMYGSVCLQSVTLPPQEGVFTNGVVRRRICETILEATHRTRGPVHINLPMSSIVRFGADAYKLDGVQFPKIERHLLTPERNGWETPVKRLKECKRILVAYGQHTALSADEQKALDNFCKRFHCVVCTDHLGNAKSSKTVNIFNLLKGNKLTPEQVKELRPDIVITMHGSNVAGVKDFVMKYPNAAHWDISPSGVAADPYRKLRRIFECTPVRFFKRVNAMVGDITVDDSYYQLWKSYEQLDDPIPAEYSQKYAVYHTLKQLPSHALLHLANSNTIRMGCAYALPEGVEVYCNRGTNGIDGSASAFMGQVAISPEQPCFLLIGDLSFFYDMNSLWHKKLTGNVRIMLFNNSGAGLLRHHGSEAITFQHTAVAEGWVKSLGFTYLSSRNAEEFHQNLERFVSNEDTPMFFEVFTS